MGIRPGQFDRNIHKIGHLGSRTKYPYEFRSGQAINQPFGYIAERLFVDDDEAPILLPNYSEAMSVPMGGDIKYKDVNKDG